jgi:DNA-binding response OmpR family regulator
MASALRDLGCRVSSLADPAQLVERCSTSPPDVVVIAVAGPGRSAYLAAAKRACREYRTPTIVVTDTDDVDARVQAIAFEADATVSPLAPNEAIARVSTLVRRSRRDTEGRPWTFGDLRIDPSKRLVTRRGEVVQLTTREFDVLLTLVEHRERPVSKTALLERVWPDAPRSVNAVEAQISSLRRKLDEHGPPLIHTVHGQGYSFRAATTTMTRIHSDPLAAREQRLREREEAIARRAKILRALERAYATR